MVARRAARSRTLGTKLQLADYERVLAQLRPHQKPSEWLRDIVLGALERQGATAAEEVLLAELGALRRITTNLLYRISRGQRLDESTLREIVERADEDKDVRARDRLAAGPQVQQPTVSN